MIWHFSFFFVCVFWLFCLPMDCQGNPIEVDHCRQPICPEATTTVSPLQASGVRTGSGSGSEEEEEDLTAICRCGCSQQLQLSNASFTLAASSAMCFQPKITWIFDVMIESSSGRTCNDLQWFLRCHCKRRSISSWIIYDWTVTVTLRWLSATVPPLTVR